MSQKAAFLALVISLFLSLPAFADDWVVTRMRGTVYAKADSDWQKLKRGAVIPDDRQLRTSENGHIELARGNETLVLQPNTQIRISDKAGAKPYTIVSQDFGTVQVEAEVREVAHFEVRTDVLAAVVKGTKFVVTADEGGARVDVKRGHVYVEDTVSHSSVVVAVGQQASFAKGADTLEVDGRGKLPAVVDRRGNAVREPGSIAEKAEKALKGGEAPKQANGMAGGPENGQGNSGNGNGNSGQGGSGNSGNVGGNGQGGDTGHGSGGSPEDNGKGKD